MYVIKRSGDGKYVNQSGCRSSYTYSLEHARKFPTKESAEAEKCGNEYVVSVYDLL